MNEFIEIPFGAKDSELMEATYFIPQGYHAVIDGDKVIIKKGEEPISNDLEQAAVEAFKHIVDSDKNNFYEIFKAGANWQKEQMMKDAVDGEVGYWNITGLSINMKLPKCIEDDDKVKVIIVKEE